MDNLVYGIYISFLHCIIFKSRSELPCFVYHEMIIAFFPTMTILTIHHILTPSLLIIHDIIKFIPIRTIFWLIFQTLVFEKRSPKVLWIMGINTVLSIMLKCERTPHCFVFLSKMNFWITYKIACHVPNREVIQFWFH